MTEGRGYLLKKPNTAEYDPFYQPYIDAAPAGSVIESLRDQRTRIADLFEHLDEDKLDFRYRPDRWSVREVLGHITDSERVFSYRALRFARADSTRLPGMDQNRFMAGADFSSRPIRGMLAEFEGLRTSNIELYDSMDANALDRTGVASECRFTVRSLIWITLGHCEHHIGVLHARYLARL